MIGIDGVFGGCVTGTALFATSSFAAKGRIPNVLTNCRRFMCPSSDNLGRAPRPELVSGCSHSLTESQSGKIESVSRYRAPPGKQVLVIDSCVYSSCR